MEQSRFNLKNEKSYNGQLMEKGRVAEEIVLESLRKRYKSVTDLRKEKSCQRLEADFQVETFNNSIFLAEIKSDQNLGSTQNFLFEVYRINHNAPPDSVFYLGWAFRSAAKTLYYYYPNEQAVYEFEFQIIRQKIGLWVSECNRGRCPRTQWEFTDKVKTTFNILIPQKHFEGNFQKYFIDEDQNETLPDPDEKFYRFDPPRIR